MEAIHKVSPRTKFIGMVNSYPPTNSDFFHYFRDRGVSVVNESMLPAYVGQFPDLALLDWQTGKPNARFALLKALAHGHKV